MERSENCAQFATGKWKVNEQKNSTAQFAAEQYIFFIFRRLEASSPEQN
jgi:hypothetical protein